MTKAQQVVIVTVVIAALSAAGFGYRYSIGLVQGSEDVEDQFELWKKNGFPVTEDEVFVGGRTPDSKNAAVAFREIEENQEFKSRGTLSLLINEEAWSSRNVQVYLDANQAVLDAVEKACERPHFQPETSRSTLSSNLT